jgi:hypothetical protein
MKPTELSREEHEAQAKQRALEAGRKLAAFRARQKALRHLGLNSYEDYLKCEHWLAFRKPVLDAQRVRLGLDHNKTV